MDVHPPKNGINRYWSIPIWIHILYHTMCNNSFMEVITIVRPLVSAPSSRLLLTIDWWLGYGLWMDSCFKFRLRIPFMKASCDSKRNSQHCVTIGWNFMSSYTWRTLGIVIGKSSYSTINGAYNLHRYESTSCDLRNVHSSLDSWAPNQKKMGSPIPTS